MSKTTTRAARSRAGRRRPDHARPWTRALAEEDARLWRELGPWGAFATPEELEAVAEDCRGCWCGGCRVRVWREGDNLAIADDWARVEVPWAEWERERQVLLSGPSFWARRDEDGNLLFLALTFRAGGALRASFHLWPRSAPPPPAPQ